MVNLGYVIEDSKKDKDDGIQVHDVNITLNNFPPYALSMLKSAPNNRWFN